MALGWRLFLKPTQLEIVMAKKDDKKKAGKKKDVKKGKKKKDKKAGKKKKS